jgi:hypothetical protein
MGKVRPNHNKRYIPAPCRYPLDRDLKLTPSFPQ